MNETFKPCHPKILCDKRRIVETKLEKYVCDKLIKNGKGRVLVTIPRKGHVIIEHLSDNIKVELDKTFEYRMPLEEFLEREELHNNKIIVFDDAVNEGRKINDFFEKFKNVLGQTDEEFLRFRKKNIKIGAFIVNDEICEKLVDEGILDRKLIGKSLKKILFLSTVLDIITFLIHTGDIIDPDHLIIEGTFKNPVPYSRMWHILENTNDELYEADFCFHHPEKKKVTLYNLPYYEWINVEDFNVINEKFRCMVRFVFDVEQSGHDLLLTGFVLAPVINPKIKIGKPGECLKSKPRLCEITQNREPDENKSLVCVDCVLFELIIKVMQGFMKKWRKNLEDNNVIVSDADFDIKWTHMFNVYNTEDNLFSPENLKNDIILANIL